MKTKEKEQSQGWLQNKIGDRPRFMHIKRDLSLIVLDDFLAAIIFALQKSN